MYVNPNGRRSRRGVGDIAVSPSLLTGQPNYLSDSTPFVQGMPVNCDIGLDSGGVRKGLPADGASCFTAIFPFVGTLQYGCGSGTYAGGYGQPYAKCVPPFLKGEGLVSFDLPIRIGVTGLLAYLLLGGLR